MNQGQNCLDDDNLEVDQSYVKYKREGLSCKVTLIIFGSICILLGLIDMIVFYVVPNNAIRQNKRNFPDFEFEQPDKMIVAVHFLEHIFLIFTGVMIILGSFPHLPDTLAYIIPLIFCSLITVSFYVLQVISCFSESKLIAKEDFKLDQLSNILNKDHPFDYYFTYVTGEIKGYKGRYRTCYSEGGISLPIESNLTFPSFDPSSYKPDFFYLEISQNVSLSDELFDWFQKADEKVVSCENKFKAVHDYYPLVQGRQLISKGKKMPSKFSKSSAYSSNILGVGVYYELYRKSIPIKKFVQNSNAHIKTDFDYNKTILDIDCSEIGICDDENKPVKK